MFLGKIRKSGRGRARERERECRSRQEGKESMKIKEGKRFRMEKVYGLSWKEGEYSPTTAGVYL